MKSAAMTLAPFARVSGYLAGFCDRQYKAALRIKCGQPFGKI